MMTDRSLQSKRERALRYLDLSFEGRESTQNIHTSVRNKTRAQNTSKDGKRPAVELRVGNKKSVDYTAQLEADIQRLLETENHGNTAPEGRPAPVTREPTSSKEPTFSPDRGMAQNKLESQTGYQYNRVGSSKPKPQPTPSEGRPLHRQGQTHRYLMATEKRPQTALGYEGSHRLGRPTRTSLLRARQRCNSAPVVLYESRKEMQKRASQRAEAQQSRTSQFNNSFSDLLSTSVPPGESLRGYLIGARYNSITWIRDLSLVDSPRAHHLDDKSLKEYGVYVPRHTNGGAPNCFVVKKMKLRQQEQEMQEQEPSTPSVPSHSRLRPKTATTSRPRFPTSPPSPSSPPPSPNVKSSPSSSSSSSSSPSLRSMENHPSLIVTPRAHMGAAQYKGRQAWSEKARLEINNQEASRDKSPTPLSVELINPSDGIGIQGVGFIGSPPKVSRPTTSRTRLKNHHRYGPDPDVMIKGRGYVSPGYVTPSYVNTSPITTSPDTTSPVNTSPVNTSPVNPSDSSGSLTPRPISARPKTGVQRVTAREVSWRLQQEDGVGEEQEQESVPTSSPEDSLEGPVIDQTEIMSVGSDEDPSLLLRSGGDPSPLRGVDPSPSPHQPTPDTPQEGSPLLEQESRPSTGEKLTPIISRASRVQSARGKKSRVRFADEIPPQTGASELVEDPIFMTEKRDASMPEIDSDLIQSSEDKIMNGGSTAPMEDAGDRVESAGQGDGATLSDDLSTKDGSGDYHPEEDEVEVNVERDERGGVKKMVFPRDENDDGSVVSDEQSADVITVDITPKSPSDNQPHTDNQSKHSDNQSKYNDNQSKYIDNQP